VPSPEELAEQLDDLYRFARAITGDPDLAGDLVHDTFIRAMERRDQFAGESLGAWMRRILHNLAIDRVRRSSREIVMEDVEEKWQADEYTVDPAVVAERAQTREELEDALVRLPFGYRSTVILHDVEQWKVREIAEVQGISLPAAKQRLRRGRMMLVAALAEGHERRMLLKEVPMQCWDARKHVSDYLDGTLEATTASLVETHLAACPTCPPLYAALVDAHSSLAEYRDPDSVIPPDLRERILSERLS
jgi:RNA polymerase sigma-70 factor (ECF subfamily)